MYSFRALSIVLVAFVLIFPPQFAVSLGESAPSYVGHLVMGRLPRTGLATLYRNHKTYTASKAQEPRGLSFYSIAYRLTVGALLKIPHDEFKVLAIFVLSYPLAFLLRQIPRSQRRTKNAFVVAVGLLYLRYIFGDLSAISSIGFSSTAVYTVARWIKGRSMPWIAMALLMSHLSILHLARLLSDHNGFFICVNVTQTQMILAIKLTSFCWSLQDGRHPKPTQTTSQKQKAIDKMPDVLEYAAYILFFPNLFTEGVEYYQYRQWIDYSMFDQKPTTAGDHGSNKASPTNTIPNGTKAAILKALSGLFCTILFINLSTAYPIAFLLHPQFLKQPFAQRLWILHVTAFWCRARSYALWAFAEGAGIMCGMGYSGTNGATGTVRWDRMQNANPLGVELAQNSKAYIGNWNVSTQSWLRDYVYLRVTPAGQKPGAWDRLVTFMFSALWHGFYPGYYMTFVFVGMLDTVAKGLRKQIRPHILAMGNTSKLIYDISSWACTQIAFDFAVVPFLLLGVGASIHVWSTLSFYGFVAVVFGFLVLKLQETKATLEKILSFRYRALDQHIANSRLKKGRLTITRFGKLSWARSQLYSFSKVS